MGTSRNKATLIDISGKIIGKAIDEYDIEYPQTHWAQQNPEDWWEAICHGSRRVLEETGTKPEEIVGVSFSVHMQGTIPITEEGEVLHPALIWLDARAHEEAAELIGKGITFEGYNIRRLLKWIRITGGCPGHTGRDPVCKQLWIKKNHPDIFDSTFKFLDSKDYVIYKCTGDWVTSRDAAYLTWLVDSRKGKAEWSKSLFKLTGLDIQKLPRIAKTTEVVGRLQDEAASAMGLKSETPVINGAGDMTSAAIGSGGLEEGEIHASIGTSDWVGAHLPERRIDIRHYTGAICSAHPDIPYLCVGQQETAGACLEWIKDNILHPEEGKTAGYKELDKLAEEINPGSDNLIFTPWLYGERSPLDDHYVRGGLYNLSLRHSRGHLIRAVLEGVAMNINWVLHYVEKLAGSQRELRLIGGGANSPIWCQIIADVTNHTVLQINEPQEAGARGAALLGFYGLGLIENIRQMKSAIQVKDAYSPNQTNTGVYSELFERFQEIYENNKKWFRIMNQEASP